MDYPCASKSHGLRSGISPELMSPAGTSRLAKFLLTLVNALPIEAGLSLGYIISHRLTLAM